jgi:hypothetical protein
MRNVYVAMPSYTGKPDIETLHCLRNVADGIQRHGWGLTFKFTVGNSFISHARDRFVADFMAREDFTDLVMLDDDLWWEDDAVLRLLSHNVDVVGGVYPKKEEPLTFPVKRFENEAPDSNGLLRVRMLPGGFMRFSRAACEKMYAAYPDLNYHDEGIPGGKNCALFLPALRMNDENTQMSLWGEDFMFCQRWREIGGEVYADTLLRFKHIGRKSYEACYADYLPEVTNAQPG